MDVPSALLLASGLCFLAGGLSLLFTWSLPWRRLILSGWYLSTAAGFLARVLSPGAPQGITLSWIGLALLALAGLAYLVMRLRGSRLNLPTVVPTRRASVIVAVVSLAAAAILITLALGLLDPDATAITLG